MNKSGTQIDYSKENAVEDLARYLKGILSDKEDVIIVNIGTDKCIGDAIGVLVGTMLMENNFKFPVYGTLKEPVHALNLDRKIKEIKLKHPNAFIIGIDACIGYEDCVGQIQVSKGAVHPGKGVGKMLPPVGDYKIVAVVDTIDNSDMFSINIRLDFVMNMSKVIAKALLIATDEIHMNKKEIAVCNL